MRWLLWFLTADPIALLSPLPAIGTIFLARQKLKHAGTSPSGVESFPTARTESPRWLAKWRDVRDGWLPCAAVAAWMILAAGVFYCWERLYLAGAMALAGLVAVAAASALLEIRTARVAAADRPARLAAWRPLASLLGPCPARVSPDPAERPDPAPFSD